MAVKLSLRVRSLAAGVLALSAAIALAEVIFPALATRPAQEVQQMTNTSMTGMMSSTQMTSTIMSTVVAPIPGFPAESIFLGLVLALSLLVLLRTRHVDQ